MTVIAFVGKPRTGKTLHMTVMAYDAYKNGHEIFANYKLSFPYKNVSVQDMLQIPFSDVDRHPKTLCIQEADKIFDSHRSMRNENTLLSSLTGQAGKRNLNIFLDTQFWNRLDNGLRYIVEYIVYCSCYVDARTKEPIAFEYEMIDVYDYSSKKYTIPAMLLKPFYEMYNSYETTKPLTETQTMGEIIDGTTKPKHRKKRD